MASNLCSVAFNHAGTNSISVIPTCSCVSVILCFLTELMISSENFNSSAQNRQI
ncbi:hypothetical protein LINPERHAP1_LOCUS24374 [Linum perenne]